MKIGILGSGDVAKTLASGFLKYGNAVMVGSRDPAKLRGWEATQKGNFQTGTFKESAAYGDVVVLAVKGSAAEEVIKSVGSDVLSGKTIIDTTNPIADDPPENGVLKFFTTLDRSLMEDLQEVVPEAHFVKAFNSAGNLNMVDPDFGDTKPTMFICGDNINAKEQVAKILDQFGWEVADVGGKESARAIEPLCILWCIPGMLGNEWTHAFKLLHR